MPSVDASDSSPLPKPVASASTLTWLGGSSHSMASRPPLTTHTSLRLSLPPFPIPRSPRPLPSLLTHLFIPRLPHAHPSLLSLLFPTIHLRYYLPPLDPLQSDSPATLPYSQRLADQRLQRARPRLITTSSVTPICPSQTGCSFEADTYRINSGPTFNSRKPSTAATTDPSALAASLHAFFVAAHNDLRSYHARLRQPGRQLRRLHWL